MDREKLKEGEEEEEDQLQVLTEGSRNREGNKRNNQGEDNVCFLDSMIDKQQLKNMNRINLKKLRQGKLV